MAWNMKVTDSPNILTLVWLFTLGWFKSVTTTSQMRVIFETKLDPLDYFLNDPLDSQLIYTE